MDRPPPSLRAELRTQRGRILDGMAHAVALHGYSATAVADVLDHCGVSRRTFYQHFANKEECFVAAYELGIERAALEMSQAFAAAGPAWTERMRAALRRIIAFIVAEPAFARLCLVEVLGAGPRALERRAATLQRFSRFLESAIEHAPGDALPPALPEAIVGGVQSVVTARLLAGREDELPGLVDDLLLWSMAPFVGIPRPITQDMIVSR